MTQQDLFQTAISSQPDILAPHFQLHRKTTALERKTHATSIRTSLKSLHAKDPLLQFSRMFLGIFPLASMRYSMIWQVRATPQGRLFFQAVQSQGRDITETECSLLPRLWPTPTARDGKGGYLGGRMRNGKVSWDTLDVAVQHTDNPDKTPAQLNPEFAEYLMGYPVGWTSLQE
tara:strand:+ start:154 stop:675 length:522 start_codon:yes stop_codon:yes gene_type:complete